MMYHMEMRDVVEEEAALPAQKRAVNGSGGAALEVPLLATIMR